MSIKTTPKEIFGEYRTGNNHKNSIGEHGIREQSKINERFFVGDQWYGAKCGNDRPLVRQNIIKRLGDYKMAIVGANPIAVNFSADGVPNTTGLYDKEDIRAGLINGELKAKPDEKEINYVMGALSDYYGVTAERVKFDDIKEQALRNAYISGTGIIYTYWDNNIKTGLYADKGCTTPITGDIKCEVLDVENVVFGNPNLDDVQEQPYIIIAKRMNLDDIRREAITNKRPGYEIENIKCDNDFDGVAGQRGENEPQNAKRAVVLTKIWKEFSKSGGDYKIKAVKVCQNAIIKSEWELGLRYYPIAKMSWERRHSSIYGDSEVTYLIPNQIAINRALTASVWAMMVMGMPIMIKDADVVSGNITNMPGQIIDVNRGGEGVSGAVAYLNPPAFNGQYDAMIQSLISTTLAAAGANDAALGNMKPDNMSAIVAVREAATMPMQTVQNRFYALCEDTARIWADFWLNCYGNRSIKINDHRGTWYLPFNARRYRNLLISVKVDVGASTLWGEAQVISTLDNLLKSKVITPKQYFERIPKGLIPDVIGLQRDLEQGDISTDSIINGLSDWERAEFESLPAEIQQQMLDTALRGE